MNDNNHFEYQKTSRTTTRNRGDKFYKKSSNKEYYTEDRYTSKKPRIEPKDRYNKWKTNYDDYDDEGLE